MKKYYSLLLLLFGILITLAIGCQNSSITKKSVARKNLEATAKNTITIAIISDLNSQYGATDYEPEIDKAISLITTRWKPDLVLGGGDAIAGQKKSLTKPQIKAMWEVFDARVAKPLRDYNLPYAFTIGNHDGSGAVKNRQLIFAKERDLAAAYWNDERHDSGLNFVERANFPFYYTFQQDNIFYLVWDASTNKIAPQQLAWVEKSLSSDLARQAPMRIAIGHLPLYPVAKEKNKSGEYLAEADTLRSLLEKYRVHTYISGHHHAYYPGKKNLLQLLHAGALGQGARQLIGSDLLPRNTITLMKIEPASNTTTYITYDIKTLEIIRNSQLPRFISGENGLILRHDLSSINSHLPFLLGDR